jgi:hypothetical protein
MHRRQVLAETFQGDRGVTRPLRKRVRVLGREHVLPRSQKLESREEGDLASRRSVADDPLRGPNSKLGLCAL